MKVPQYTRQNESLAVPSLSSPQIPTAPQEAFGGSKFQALERMGDAGQKIAGLLKERQIKRQKEEADALNESLNTEFRLSQQDRLFSEEIEDIDIDGRTISRPKGLLNFCLQEWLIVI